MISKLRILIGNETVPYRNIAMERVLMLGAEKGDCILYLWQNCRTVVIGRNQNAWEECNIEELKNDGGFLARRFSGGGAVYHDLGNMNFSFLTRREDYDPVRQSEVILHAIRKLGIPAQRTGRNDLEADGRKFSGHAYYKIRDCGCHHGTLMMDVNMSDMGKYLNVSADKLRSKGVASVRSRVMNLKELCPGLTSETLKTRLIEAFQEEYGMPAEAVTPDRLPWEKIRKEEDFLASDLWLFPSRIPFTAEWKGRFSWGGILIQVNVKENLIDAAECWSDAMEENLILRIRECLVGCRYDPEAMSRRIIGIRGENRSITSDIAGMIRKQ